MGSSSGVIISAEVDRFLRDEVDFTDDTIEKIKKLEIYRVRDLIEVEDGDLESVGVSFPERGRFMERVHSTSAQPPPAAPINIGPIEKEVLAMFKMEDNVTPAQARIECLRFGRISSSSSCLFSFFLLSFPLPRIASQST